MSGKEQSAVVDQWLEAWNRQDLKAAADLLTPDYKRHDANLPDVDGPRACVDFITTVVSAFPDIRLHIEHIAVQEDFVWTRLIVRGTHSGGPFMGVPTSGREITVEVTEVYRLSGGRIAEQWVLMNALGLLQQLGAIPSS